MITGKGRCNVTNDCDVQDLIASVPSNGRFLYSAASAFPPRDVMAFFEAQGLPLKVERGNRVFPTSDHAVDVVDTLIRYMKRSGVEMLTGEAKQLLLEDGTVQGAELQGGARIWPGRCWLRAAVCRIQGRAPRGMAMRLHVRLAISSRGCAPRWCPWWPPGRTVRR